MTAASIADLRLLARRRLPRFLFDYIDGGAYAEVTLRRNVEDLAAIALKQRVLRDVSAIDMTTELFGEPLNLPVVLAPVGLSGLYARRGEVQAARAAAAAGVRLTLSTMAVCGIEEVRAASPNPFWFQLYMLKDRGFVRDMLARAVAAKCPVLVFTVDLPLGGKRYRDYHSGMTGSPGALGDLRRFAQALARPGWALDVGLAGRPHRFGNLEGVVGGGTGIADFLTWASANFDASATWRDLDWIRESWTGKLVIKGVLEPEDARAAASLGADGIVVSNHGGRQLDGVRSSAAALPRIAERVGDRLTVLVDGGVRSGLDVARMLALGAKGVMVGRAWAYALGAGGEAGVAAMLEMLRSELHVAMTLTGCTRLAEITGEILDRDEH